MANKTLAYSIVWSICITINYLVDSDTSVPIKVVILCGMASSMANHTLTSKVLQTFDRMIMRVIAIIYMHILKHHNERYLVLLGVVLYVMSKQEKNRILSNIYHIGAHMCATYLNIFILSGTY